ncbi:putative monooxygenase [Nocardiopsis kunsanensis]|uniref:Monooxygenase n=1 Tax=Nocardiopsis kunsanensis TaxID=141693 RepID=A0A918XJY6_9ACTN|nr:NAD(P)/FAD-dependent oxidoreductase [Nocardiopsis kunsanensis]GHD35711.1 putative monooxygenase [Nocardiopsis kunsanensis]
MTSNDCQVAVVGAGPAGLVAALSLHARGLRPQVLEARAPQEPVPGSRALFVHHESMSAIDSVSPGTGQRISDIGIMWSGRATWYAGRQVFGRRDGGAEYHGGGIAPYASLPQSRTVEILRQACDQLDIPIRMSTTVKGVRPGSDRVVIDTEAGPVHTEYVIAADGARSAVRKAVGIDLTGPRLDGYHVVVDVMPDSAEKRPTERILHYRVPDFGGRNLLVIPFAGGFQLDVQAKSQQEAKRLEDVAAWLPRVVPHVSMDEVTWVSTYRFSSVVADSMTDASGRVLLVGEAAHLFPPFGARGMNSAIADSDAAAAAVALDTRSGGTAGVARFASSRLPAARINAKAAARGFRVLHSNRRMRAMQWAAARASHLTQRAGQWLEDAPYSASARAGGRY